MTDPRHPVTSSGVTEDTAERMDYDETNPATWDAPWSINSDAVADWAARKLAAARQEKERLTCRYVEEIAAAQAWLEREVKGPDRDIAFFEGHLTAYHRSKRPDGGRYPLRHGVLASRKGSEVVEVDDEAAFVAWAKANREDLLRIKTEIDKAAVKKIPAKDGRFVVDGEIVPGVRLVEKDRTWKVETTSEEQPAWLPAPAETVGVPDEASAA